jgi:nucleoside-diphosphate-sugar epimerase
MKSIFITGSTGFVGKNVLKYFNSNFVFNKYNRESIVDIKEDIVLHFAGKAHDLKNVSNFEEYYIVNTELSKKIFDYFLESEATVFITLSSVKAVADEIDCELTEEYVPNPISHYGKSKLMAEKYILSKNIPIGKRVYILRPCMIHGPGNKGNFNLLYNFIKRGYPWPLGSFENNRSFCSVENLCFVIENLINQTAIESGIYNIADDESVSSNDLISLISKSLKKNTRVLKIPKKLIFFIAKIGDKLKLPFNSRILTKLTETYVVSNRKLINSLKIKLPVSSKDGIISTIKSFN